MGEIFRLKVTLMDCRPPIWREVEVASSATLVDLHDILQALMAWDDYHLWAFEFGKRRFELRDPDGMSGTDKPPEDPARVTLGELLMEKKSQNFAYNYDFGDDWWLDIKVVAIGKPEPKVRYPRCLAGERSSPPEDCGGAPGFEELLAARRNPKSARAREFLEWVGTGWNPEVFDIVAVNKELAALRAPRRLH